MGIYEKMFARGFKKHYVRYLGLVNDLPPVDAQGLAIDKVGLQHNVKTVLDYSVQAAGQLSRQPNHTGDEFNDLWGFLATGVMLCDHRRWEPSLKSDPDKLAKILFDLAEFSWQYIAQMKAQGDYSAAQAWGAISETYLRVLHSSGRGEEMITAVERYAAIQNGSANASS
ncbi:MAG: hypothetical protein JW395_1882 [Nitrospira sp.]|nr:hypothetical protein [Nitrospira sp.]